MTVQTSSGLTVSISIATPATFDKVGFDALTFTTIGEVTSVGEYGGTQEEVNHTPLNTAIVEKFKGATNYGSMALEFGYNVADAGQILLQAGSIGAQQFTKHSVKVEFSDGSIDYLYGFVFGYAKNPGAINSIVSGSSTIGIDKPIVDGT